MKHLFRAIPLFVCMIICTSCGGGSSVKNEQWREKSIEINVKGDPQLNLFQNSSHALYLCTCQLKDPNAFNQLIDERGGIERLLSECGRFDGSVAYSKRYVVQPGQTITDMQDHAEGARFMGVVAGYYRMKRESVVRLFKISKSLTMTIDLGPREILDIAED
ncbi:MAG TPA: type VI secretion lipoprotein TssJ [Geobacteraceae bacterium]